MQQPELSKKLFKMIKSENHAIGAYEAASRERISIASQLSDWGEATGDDSISDISDKLGVLMSEIGEQEDVFGQNLEDYRAILKQIRNTEGSVQPSRDQKAKIADEIAKLKYKEPQSPKIVQLEQELVRAEAQNLVAEAQLTNIVCRSSMSDRQRDASPLTILFLTDAPETQRSLRHPLRSHDRARRKADHARPPWTSPLEPARRYTGGPWRHTARFRARRTSSSSLE